MKALIVEDDELLLQGLVIALERKGYICDAVSTVRIAEASLQSGHYSLIILDLGLPDDDGINFLLRLRQNKISVPVLILTARDSVNDRIIGLDAGADDYLLKPFSLDELLARVRALIRRHLNEGDETLNVGEFSLNINNKQIFQAGKALELTPKEYAILSRLMFKAGQPVHREVLFNDIYNWSTEPATNTLEVHIHNLREKIGRSFIKTTRGFGYTLVVDEE